MASPPNNTVPTDGTVVDARPGGEPTRSDSSNSTVIQEGGAAVATADNGEPYKVDTHYAAQLRPSRLHGKQLSFMVNCLAGVGVSRHEVESRDLPETDKIADDCSSSVSDTIRVS